MPRWVVTQAGAARKRGRGGARVVPAPVVPPRVVPVPDDHGIVGPVPPPPEPPDVAPPGSPPDAGASAQTSDTYAEKLVKYVPAEVLAFALPAASLNATSDGWLKTIIVAGLVTTPLYLVSSARLKPAAERPAPPYYVLSTLAFLPWILGASPAVSGMTGWGQARTTTILLFAVLVIPLLDQLLDTPPAEP